VPRPLAEWAGLSCDCRRSAIEQAHHRRAIGLGYAGIDRRAGYAQLVRQNGGTMRIGIVLCLIALLLVGCTPSGSGPTTAEEASSPAQSKESSSGAELPSHDPSLAVADDAGRSPDEAVLALVDAGNQSDWERMYSLYATPSLDFDTAKREWIEANESHEDFRVLEVRVSADGPAFVRVAYRATTTPPGGEPYPVTVDEPGEWWAVYKVDGLWKTQWMPRQ